MTRRLVIAAALASAASAVHAWAPVPGAMLTDWGASLTPATAWREYPRPALARDGWVNLNGLWQYAVTRATDAAAPAQWNGEILVPFAIESPLSGVGRRVSPDEALWYRRTVEVPATKAGERTLLNFEAVDYQATVWVNHTQVGAHTGGNLPFSFDITRALVPGSNTITVRVTDATDTIGAFQLHG